MQLNINRFATRVPVCRLALAALLVAVPATASMDPVASAQVEPAFEPIAVIEAELPSVAEVDETSSVFDVASWTEVRVGGVNPEVFELALRAAAAAVERGDATPSTLTVIDFSRPSTARRMWVYDLRSPALLFEELVSHGRNSGMNLATSFSNLAESNKSSLGLYRTAESYIGKHGYSLRLDGLDRGFNDRARERAIVIHGADYVSDAITKAQGRLGRSLGCPAVRSEISRKLIDTVKEGGLLFAYYPDEQWLRQSTYLAP
jgi:hypothetical protein